MIKIYKKVHLRLKITKKIIWQKFLPFRASWDPLKLQKSQKNVIFSCFRLPIDENRPFLAGNFCAPNLTPFHLAKKISAPQHAWRLQMRVEKAGNIFFWHFSFLAAKIEKKYIQPSPLSFEVFKRAGGLKIFLPGEKGSNLARRNFRPKKAYFRRWGA